MNNNPRRILLLMHTWAGYLHQVQLGVAQYLAQRPEWICTRILPLHENIANIRGMKFDGVIAYVEPEYVQGLQQLAIPVVDVSNWMPKQHFPRVLPDDLAIGRLAAGYLRDLGLRHFALLKLPNIPFCDLRRQGFMQTLAQDGFAVEEMPTAGTLTLPKGVAIPPTVDPAMAAWLLSLPKPIGVFGTFESIAAELIESCRQLGIRVPEEVCVLGADNDELTDRFTHPPLSSIALPTEKIGFEAARLLDDLMAGQPAPTQPICLAPIGVITRQSTNLLAIADKDVLDAVRYIRQHIHQSLKVEDVLRAVPVNRRYLERKFKQYIGRSPLQEIRRTRLQMAKELLLNSDLSIPVIAKRSGFPNGERLANVFHQEMGMPPTKYRKQFRLL